MSADVKIKIAVDDSQVAKIDKAQSKLESLQTRNKVTNALNKGASNINSLGKGLGTNFGGIGNFASKLGAVTKLIGPVGIGLSAIATAATAFSKAMNQMIEKGKQSFDDYEQAVAKTRVQAGSYAPSMDVDSVITDFQYAAVDGVASVGHLTETFNNLLPVLEGNVEEGKELTLLFADLEASGRTSADELTRLIAMTKEKGEVEKKDVDRLQRQGLPIYRELAKVRGEEVEATREAVKAGQVSAEEFKDALKGVAEAFKGTAAELSATTEGAKASMEAARGLAYRGAAEGSSAALKVYYGQEQQRYLGIANDEEAQQDAFDAAFRFQSAVNHFDRLTSRLGEVIEKVAGWIAKTTGLGDKDYARMSEALGQESRRVQKEAANSALTYATGENQDFVKYLGEQLKALKEQEKLWQELAKNAPDEDWWKVIDIERQAQEEAERGGFTVLAAAGRQNTEGKSGLLESEKYKNAKTRVDEYKAAFNAFNHQIAQIKAMLATEGINMNVPEGSFLEALSVFYDEQVQKVKAAQQKEERMKRATEVLKSLGKVSDDLFDAYGRQKVSYDKQILMEGGFGDVRSRTIPRPAGMDEFIDDENSKINFEKINQLVGKEKDAVVDSITEWVSKEIFGNLTNLNTIFAKAGIEPYDFTHAQDYVNDFEKKVETLYNTIQDIQGEERYIKAAETLREMFGHKYDVQNEEDLKDAIKTEISYYEAITKELEANSKTAADFMKKQLDKVREEEAKAKARMRENELKQIEMEQFTKSDSYQQLKAYKRRLEQAKREDGSNLYSNKEVSALVRKMGNKMLQDERKSAKQDSEKDNGSRYVNAHRESAPLGYIGAKVSGYRIKDESSEKQLKEQKESNKKLSEIKTAIEEVDKTPRAV